MDTKELTDSIDALTYPSYGDREERLAARQVYNEQRAKLEKQWKDWLHKEYAPSFSEDLHNHVYGKAWEDGHSYGYHEVEIHYEDLVDFVAKAIELNEA